jgi:hypothetical protein
MPRGQKGILPMPPDNETALKLIALDAEDLAIVSAHLQEAAVKVGDMAYLPKEKRFAMVVNRFDWAGAGSPARRRRAGIHFERVLAAQIRGIDLAARDAAVDLLAVEFEEKKSPSGVVTLLFAGDAAIKLDVECLEAALSDLGPSWPAEKPPRHDQA